DTKHKSCPMLFIRSAHLCNEGRASLLKLSQTHNSHLNLLKSPDVANLKGRPHNRRKLQHFPDDIGNW
ncbi:hypothetical protein J6590_098207, partial [Homalodisca vitripennis]